MRKHEFVFILDARLSENERDEAIKQVENLVNKFEGKLENVQAWIEKQKMAFPIKKVTDGTYYVSVLEMSASKVAGFRKELHILDKVLRFLIVDEERKSTK